MVPDNHEHTGTYKTNNSYIPQMEQHLPFRFILTLGNVPYLLDVTLATHCYTYSHLHLFHSMLFKFKLTNMQQASVHIFNLH